MRPRGGVIFLRIDLAHMFQKDISFIPSHPFRIKLQVMCSYNTYIYVNCHFQYGQAAIGKQQAGKIIAQKRNLRLNDACEKLQVLGDGPYPGINYIAKCYSFIVENMASSLAISGPRKKGQFGLLLIKLGIENRNTGKITKNVRDCGTTYALDFSRVCSEPADTDKNHNVFFKKTSESINTYSEIKKFRTLF